VASVFTISDGTFDFSPDITDDDRTRMRATAYAEYHPPLMT
jgi:hypothetical protein